jgi:hypothetical protein
MEMEEGPPRLLHADSGGAARQALDYGKQVGSNKRSVFFIEKCLPFCDRFANWCSVGIVSEILLKQAHIQCRI